MPRPPMTWVLILLAAPASGQCLSEPESTTTAFRGESRSMLASFAADSGHIAARSFRIRLPESAHGPVKGRLVVALGPPGREPRRSAGEAGDGALPIFGVDIADLEPGRSVDIDHPLGVPIPSLGRLDPGDYLAQAVLIINRDLLGKDMPGNLYSRPVPITFGGGHADPIALDLTERIPDETLPPDTDSIRYLKLPSPALSAFHGRPIFLRAAVILPRDFDREPDRKYPLRVHVGGFGQRYTAAGRMLARGSSFESAWAADDAPRFVTLCLDGAGPLGDPYQVDSANHGPYGTALTAELIPHVEQEFRGRGTPDSRVLDGGSTGGWVALALQVFYPDFFNGAWGFCPDSVDFRDFQLVNIYEDDNAYTQPDGSERPAFRETDGTVGYTMRHECGLENVLGAGDSWTMSGGQWGSWNATYGPRGRDGRPVPLWDPRTGRIDHAVAEHWKKYDLRRILEENWADLGPKLRGKLHVRVGSVDNYFLERAVHRLEAFLSDARPAYEGTIAYGPGEGHCWSGITEPALLRLMADRTEKRGD